jgi:hypothetical protein
MRHIIVALIFLSFLYCKSSISDDIRPGIHIPAAAGLTLGAYFGLTRGFKFENKVASFVLATLFTQIAGMLYESEHSAVAGYHIQQAVMCNLLGSAIIAIPITIFEK